MAVVVAAVGVAASIGGVVYGAVSSSNAADEAAEAAEKAQGWRMKQYYQQRADMMPWMTSGAQAVEQLWKKVQEGPGQYQKSPYYNFLQKQGTQAMERGAAARGNQLSGGEQKALTQFGQNLASTDYDKWLNQWYQSLTPYQSLAGLGQTSTAQANQLQNQSGQDIANWMMQGGQARAAGQMGQGNTWANALGQVGNQANNLYWMNQMFGGGGGGSMYNPQTNWPAADINSMLWL